MLAKQSGAIASEFGVVMSINSGRVIWLTGMSGAGKSTLSIEVVKRIRSLDKCVVFLDGDELREILNSAEVNAKNHGRDVRLKLAFQYAKLCWMIANQGINVVIATISLFKEVHNWNRINLLGYFEVYLKVPLEELRRRDPKSIYSRFDAGEISNVSGLDLPIDEPEAADWVIDYDPNITVESLADNLLDRLNIGHK